MTVSNIISKSYDLIPFEAKWADAFSQPESCGVWFIWGHSGNGKTNFVLQLIKELTKYENVLLNSREEGASLSLKRGLLRTDFSESDKNLYVVNEDIPEMTKRLKMRKSPRIAIIDSFQYTQLNYSQYIDFKEQFTDKLLILTSHAEGKMPAGRSARSVMYDAALKIWVEGYIAFSKGRFIGPTGQYMVWQEGASKYW